MARPVFDFILGICRGKYPQKALYPPKT